MRQASKRGRHFYTQCDCCGVQMGTAAPRQTKIWQEAEFSPPEGVNVYKPANVSEEQQARDWPIVGKAVQPESEPAQSGQGDAGERWRPGEGEPEETEPEAENSSGNTGALVALGVAALAVVGGLWMS